MCGLLAPLEITMEKANKRRLQVFPPYDLSFEASVPALFEMVAHRVAVDAERPWINPFHEFLEAAEEIRIITTASFRRRISKTRSRRNGLWHL